MRRTLAFSFCLIFAIVVAGSVHAAAKNWTGSAPVTEASDARNWNGGTSPVSGDVLTIAAGQTAVWDIAGVVPSSLATSGVVTLTSPLITTGDLTISGGSLSTIGASMTIGGSIFLNGGVLNAPSSALTVSGGWKFAGGTANLVGSTVSFLGQGTHTITSAGNHFDNVNINSEGMVIELADTFATDGTLSLGGGKLLVSGPGVMVTGELKLSGGTLALGKNRLILAGSSSIPFSRSGGAIEMAPEGTIEYQGVSGSVTIPGGNYSNLVLGGKALYSLSGDVTVTGTLTIETAASLSTGGYTLSVPSGLVVNHGTILTAANLKSPATTIRVLDDHGAALSSLLSTSAAVQVELADGNRNFKGGAVDTTSGIVVTTLSGDREQIPATETVVGSGIFQTARFVVHQGTPTKTNGQIELSQSDILFVTYTDPNDPSDVKTTQLTVSGSSAIASGAPQIVTMPRVGNFSSQTTGSGTTYTAHFTWETDQVSSSSVSVSGNGLTMPLAAGLLTGVQLHDVALAGLKRGGIYTYTVTSVTAEGKSVTSPVRRFTVITDGDRVQASGSKAVYWYLSGTRAVFADFTSYDSWFPDFTNVVIIPSEQLADMPIGGTVPVRGGTYLVKIQSDPKVYVVEPYGTLRWLPTEAKAIALYGSTWSKRVRDIDVSLFVAYTLGADLSGNALPENFFYQTASNGYGMYFANSIHTVTEEGRVGNRMETRFLSRVSPTLFENISSGAAVPGYTSDVQGVLRARGTAVSAPALF